MIDITNRQTIQEQIIPLLFYERSAKKYLKSADEYFKETGIDENKIVTEFKELQEPQDCDFWKKITDILSIIYEVDMNSEKLLQLCKEDFETFIKKLLVQRFEYEFSTINTDSKLINDFETLNDILGRDKKTIFIEDNERSTAYLFYPTEKKEAGNLKPFTPGEQTFYPTLLVKIEAKSNKIHFGGGKRERNKVISMIERENEDVFRPEEVTEFKDFSVIPYQMFSHLHDQNIHIKGIKIKDPYLSMNVSSKKEFIELDSFINLELMFFDIEDFLKISEIEFIYLKKISGDIQEIPFKIFINREKQLNNDKTERFFKVNMKVTTRKKQIDTSDVQNEIIEKLAAFNIDVDKPYNLPISYFFKRFINENDVSRGWSFNVIKEIDPQNRIMNMLITENIIDDKVAPMLFDIEKFLFFMKKLVSENLIGKTFEEKDDKFLILDTKKERNNLILRVKLLSDKPRSKFQRYYHIRIPLKSRLSKKSKIYDIVLSDINYYGLIDSVLSGKYNLATRHIYAQLKNYLLFQYPFMLEKESFASYTIIKDFIEKPSNSQSMDRKKLGDTLEEHTNILLKYLFGNYLIYGGPNKPDGYLVLDEHKYIIDSKMHKELKQPEFRKIKSYMEDFCREEKLPETDAGMFIISETLIKDGNGSLNPSSKKEIFKNTDYKVGFISLEFIIKLYEIYRTNISRFKNELLKLYIKSFNEAFETSLDANNIEDLEKSEKEVIDDLIHEIERNESQYLPSTEMEGP